MPAVLYKRQKDILNFLREYIDKYGYSPTLGEIAEAMGLSSLATVHEHLMALVKKGAIRKFEGTVRGVELLDEFNVKPRTIEIPLLGFIAAGQPIMPYTDPGATVSVAPHMISDKKKSYVLQVKGDSMIESGILDGDYVIIEEQSHASDGDIVVALLDSGLATLKKFFREPDRIRLEPANSAMDPIYVNVGEVQIQGKCSGVIRRFE
ncbi:transcriptional repressor LexA [Candidatus Daviesbacteria bacterium]|nr:transcriptional repressor LexA [Candidatus Daviesbacteria bacterium]